MTELTTEVLAELRELLRGRTRPDLCPVTTANVFRDARKGGLYPGYRSQDGELAAAAFNALPALLDTAEREAAARKRVEGFVERAAAIVEDGYRCMNCGAVFLGREGHPQPECSRPSWGGATEAEKVAMIRALSPTEQEKG